MLSSLLLFADEASSTPQNLQETINESGKLLETVKQASIEHGPGILLNVLAILAIFFIGRIAANWITRLAAAAMRRARVDEMLIKFVRSMLYWALMMFVIMAVLNRMGVNTTSFSAVIAAAGLAIGLALQDSLSNFASGVMLILFHPFRLVDFVEAGGTAGIVEEIQIFNTVLRTPDNKRIIVPNGKITSDNVINYAAHQVRRIDMEIMCGYNDNLREVKNYLEEVLAADDRILDDPAPLVAVNELADSGVILYVRPWVRTSEYWDVKWSLTEAIKNGFDDRGFTIPYPTQDINLHNAAS